MIASFHAVAYRRRVFSPPRRLAQTVEGLRFWRPLNIGGDFAWFREHPTRRALYPRLRPDFYRWAFYAVWEDDAVLDQFLERSPLGRTWRDGTTEAWHLWLKPLRVRGRWEGMELLDGTGPAAAPEGPIACIVRADLSLRGTLAFWGSAAPGVLAHIPGDDDLLVGIPLVDQPYTQPVSFSLWRSADSFFAFAHHGDGHRDAISRVKKSQASLLDQVSSGRFLPYRSEGSWQGRNFLKEVIPSSTKG